MIKKLNENDILMISHIADIDGAGSVILANKVYKNKVDYILINPEELYNLIKDIDYKLYKKIFICDISIDLKSINYILSNKELEKLIQHFDHHESEIKNNKYKFVNEVYMIDNKLTCATELFFLHLKTVDNYNVINNLFFSTMVEGIRSVDTWDFKNNGNEIGPNLATLHSIIGPQNFIEVFSDANSNAQFIIPEKYQLLIDCQNQEKEKYINECLNLYKVIDYNGYKVGTIISERFRSFVGNKISSINSNLDFVLIINFHTRRCSLRTVKNNVDVSKIAKEFTKNGGGHYKAAGFPLDEESLPIIKNIVDKII